jgi:hypothetical protein
MAKNDLQGALDLLVLKTLVQKGALHGYGIVRNSCASKKARSIRLFTAWNTRDGSVRNGR